MGLPSILSRTLLRRRRGLRHLSGARQLLAIEIGRDRALAAVCCRSPGRRGAAAGFSRLARVSGFAGFGLSRGLFARISLRSRFCLSGRFARVGLRRSLCCRWRRCLCICLRSLIRVRLRRRGNAQAAKCDRGGQRCRRDRYVQFHGHESLHWTVFRTGPVVTRPLKRSSGQFFALSRRNFCRSKTRIGHASAMRYDPYRDRSR